MTSYNELPDFLDRRPVIYSFTFLNQYRNCAHAAYRKYIRRDIPYVQSEAARYGDEVHQAMKNRIGSHESLPAHLRQFEKFAAPFDNRAALTELKLAMTVEGRATGYWDKNCWFRGQADVFVLQSGKAYIRDWKTGSSKYEDPFELETNALLLKIKYPEIESIRGDYAYVKEDRIGQSYDLSRFNATWSEIQRIVKLIEADRANDSFEKHKSGLCGWCLVEDCEHHFVAKR